MTIALLSRLVRRFLADSGGTAAVEYAIVAGGLALAIVVAVASVGEAVNRNFERTNEAVEQMQ